MGDSAGGGMAPAIAQRLRDTGGRPPDRLVLIAPWLDITLGNPAGAASSPRSTARGGAPAVRRDALGRRSRPCRPTGQPSERPHGGRPPEHRLHRRPRTFFSRKLMASAISPRPPVPRLLSHQQTGTLVVDRRR
ncbi:alpha/beta hydrolase [Streptomyces hygroscopicus]|uniref:alpha/beta hydrolase n=1 Tax=Streptomyces hygroscopicus TaxID=1912 RepID=UPI003D766D9F